MEMSVRGGTTVLVLAGDVDIHTAPQVSERLDQLCDGGCASVVVDLAGVTFLDSSALSALLAAHRNFAQAGRTLRLAAPRPHVQKVFRITRLLDVIPIYDSVEDACA
jgi:anti-anti-sigma factor